MSFFKKIKKYISPNIKSEGRKVLNKIFSKPLRFLANSYEKIFNRPPINPPPSQPGWSVLVLNSGKNRESLEKFVTTVYDELKGTDYEIIVVAPPFLDLSYFDKNINLVHVIWNELSLWTVPFAISKKKNFGAKYAKYDKVVISHDYLYFLSGWKKGYDGFEDFTVCTNVVLDEQGNRHMDWVVWDYPGVGIGLLPYNQECTEYQVIGGNYFVVKRDFFLSNPMNENLRWGEAEDIDWAFSIRKKTKFKVNPASKVQYQKFKKGVIGPWLEGTKKLEKIFGQKII